MIGYIKLCIFRKKWRKKNRKNFTKALGLFPIDSVKIGNATYGWLNVLSFTNKYSLYIGSYCSIGPNVTFVLESDHELSNLSTYPFKVKILGEYSEAISKGNIVLDDDVWIGCGAVILSGVHIGQGAVVAAGSVVTKDVPPYAVVAGNPAHIIKQRFKDDIIKELLKIDYSKVDAESVKENIGFFYRNVENMSLEEVHDLIRSIQKD